MVFQEKQNSRGKSKTAAKALQAEAQAARGPAVQILGVGGP